jgi:outer membrane receptor protein involved in Fe transport
LTERTGDFRIAVTVQYLIENKFQAASSTPEVELIDDVGEPLHLKLRGGLDWVFHKFQAALGVNFQNSYRNHLFDPATHIDSWTTVDLALFYGDNTRPSKGSFLNGFRIGLSVQNLFDVPPPHISVPPAFGLDPGFDGTNASPLGRVIAAQVTKRW